jgi:hypothetical protein
MRSLSDKEVGAREGWDDPVPASVESDFREVLEQVKGLKRMDFPCSSRGAQQRPSERESHVAHFRRWISGSQLRCGLPEMGVGGWASGV